MQVIIGIDPHKASHTAVAIDSSEAQLDHKKVRAARTQVDHLLSWAEPYPARTWAIEGADGMGYLLAQQLLAAGEHVVNVPATLASRTRLLGTGRTNKNDPQPQSDGRGYFDRRVAEGKTSKEALRSLKRQISNTVYRHLIADAASRRG